MALTLLANALANERFPMVPSTPAITRPMITSAAFRACGTRNWTVEVRLPQQSLLRRSRHSFKKCLWNAFLWWS
jgi:hypothetical protein